LTVIQSQRRDTKDNEADHHKKIDSSNRSCVNVVYRYCILSCVSDFIQFVFY